MGLKFLLDTNAWIQYLRGSSPSLVARMNLAKATDIATCSMAVGELWYGVERSKDSAEENKRLAEKIIGRFVSLPFDDRAALEWARARAALALIGKPVGSHDLIVASIAIANNLTVVTHNTKDFANIPGLRIEDWQRE